VWEKTAYPEDADHFYGLSTFSRSLNYFPKWLKEGPLAVAPTDTRWRVDQRYLESGDMKKAAEEVDRLEVKQMESLKRMQEQKLEHKPQYFVEEMNEVD